MATVDRHSPAQDTEPHGPCLETLLVDGLREEEVYHASLLCNVAYENGDGISRYLKAHHHRVKKVIGFHKQNIRFVMGWTEDDTTTYIAFRGTATVEDIVADLNAFGKIVPFGQIQCGFYVDPDILQPAKAVLLEERRIRPETPHKIIFCGHSLGGARAHSCHMTMDQPGSLFRAIEVAFGNQIDLFSISFGAPWLASVRLSDFLARKASRYVNFVAKRDPIAAIMNFPKTLDRCSNLLKHVKHTFATLISFANQANLLYPTYKPFGTFYLLESTIVKPVVAQRNPDAEELCAWLDGFQSLDDVSMHLMTTYAILLHEILSDDVKSHLRSHRRLRLTVAVEEHGTGASEQNATLHEEWLGLGAYKYVNNLYFYLSRQKIDSDQAVIKFLNDVDQGATAISKRTSESDDRTLRDQAMKDLVMKYKSSFDELKPLAKEI